MDRRHLELAALSTCALALIASERALALGVQDLTGSETNQGLKNALQQGAVAAVSLLGRPGGFLDNPKVRIPLPGLMNDAAKLLKAIGRRKDVEDLENAMNRAAESAVPFAKDLLVNAARTITFTDAKNILTGGPTSVTDFFAGRTRAPLATRFLPIVTTATKKVDLAAKYNRVAAKATGLGLVKKEDATIEQYVTGKTLDGLYFMIGEQERNIRANPAASADAVVRKVFGALQGR